MSAELSTEVLSPSSKSFLSAHGGKDNEDEEEVDILLTFVENMPSEASLSLFCQKCFEESSSVCSELKLAALASSVSHPRDLHDESYSVLSSLPSTAKAKNTLVCSLLRSVLVHCGQLFSLDLLNILKAMDEFLDSISSEFSLENDDSESLPDFKFASIFKSAEDVDNAKSTHSCAKVNKDRLCLTIKLAINSLLTRLVSLCAYSMKTPKPAGFSRTLLADPRVQELEACVSKLSDDLSALSVKSSHESRLLGQQVAENSALVAALISQLKEGKAEKSLSAGVAAASKMVHHELSLLTPAESLAVSGVAGLIETVTATDSKGKINDDTLSCMFVRGRRPRSSMKRAAFLESGNSLSTAVESCRGFFPGISVEVVSPTKGDTKDSHRPIFKAGSDYVARRVNFLSPSVPVKLQKHQSNLESTDGLPRSLALMIKFLYDELEALRLFSEHLPIDMDRMIETEIGKFVYHMSTLCAALVESSDSSICSSGEGIWRGVLHLFYHQYINAFSSREKGMFQEFYPEMLSLDFDANSAYLWRQYAWKSSQLTAVVHNYLRFSCPRCLQSKLSYSSCLTASCVKAREEESLLHVFVDAKGKPLCNPAKA